MRRKQKNKFGVDLGLMHEVVKTGRLAELGKEFWAAVSSSRDLCVLLQETVEAAQLLRIPRPRFACTIPTRLTHQTVLESPLYHISDKVELARLLPGEDAAVPMEGLKSIHIELFAFYKQITRSEMMSELDQKKYRPITLIEGICLCSQHPGEVWGLCNKYWHKDGTRRIPKKLLILGQTPPPLHGYVPFISPLHDIGRTEPIKFHLSTTNDDQNFRSERFMVPAIREL